MKFFVEKYDCIFEILTWHKTNPMPTHNNCYPPDTEYCLLFREKGTGMGGTMETLKKYHISPINKIDKDNYGHPTIKPIEFVKNHLINSANGRKDIIVFDPFVGSGTTCIAAKEIGCNYLGFEINFEYYKIAIDRLNGINQKGDMDLFNTNFDEEQEKYEQLKLDL